MFWLWKRYGHKVGICPYNKLFDTNKETNKIPIYDLARVFSPKEMESATRYASLCTVQVSKVESATIGKPEFYGEDLFGT